MPPALACPVGKRVAAATITGEAVPRKAAAREHRQWRLICDCGTGFTADVSLISAGRVNRCGGMRKSRPESQKLAPWLRASGSHKPRDERVRDLERDQNQTLMLQRRGLILYTGHPAIITATPKTWKAMRPEEATQR